MQVFSNSDGCLPADCFAARPASWMIGTASVSKIFFNSDGCLQASFRLLRKQEFVFTCMCRFLMHAVPRNLRDKFLETKTCVWRICLPSWFCPCRPSWPIVTVQVLASTSVCAYALAGLPRLFLLCRCSPAHLFVLPSLQAFSCCRVKAFAGQQDVSPLLPSIPCSRAFISILQLSSRLPRSSSLEAWPL